MSENKDFVIENGVLKEYNGPGGEVVIPEGVEKIDDGTFYGLGQLEWIDLTLSQLSQSENMFKPTGKTVELHLRRGDKEALEVIASFRKEYFMQSWNYPKEYLVPLEPEDIPVYDRLVASGKYEGFQMNEDGRIKAMLLRLRDTERPVSEEFRGMFSDFLSGKISKVVKLAEKEKNAAYVRTLVEQGAIQESGAKKLKKFLAASTLSELQAIGDALEQLLADAQTSRGPETPRVEQIFLEHMREINAKGVLIKCGLEKLPEICWAGSTEIAPPEYLQLALAAYLVQGKKEHYQLDPVADEAAAKLDAKQLSDMVHSLYEHAPTPQFKAAFLPAIFRYGDGDTVGSVYRQCTKSYHTLADSGKRAVVLSDTREGMMYAEKCQRLEEYAKVRGIDVETLLDLRLTDFGLDENGEKVYDLGGNKVTVKLAEDLTISLYDGNAGKVIKTLPKKNADPKKYEAAKADFAEMKKNLKKAAKTRCDQLFQQFLKGNCRPAQEWKASYQKNPLLRQIASIVVWSQNKRTFLLRDGTPVNAQGQTYEMSDKPVKIAHPMEMKPNELAAWQKYFTAHKLRQPFAQIWEPAIDFSQIKEDRYQGVEIPAYRFKNQEKHGISFSFDYNAEYLELEFEDCWLNYEGGTAIGRHELFIQGNLVLGTFHIERESRAANHIIGLLDKWTAYGRVLKDDATVVDVLDSFTLAQVTELLNLAIEHQCTNCTAALLAYQNTHFTDFDPMDRFMLDI